MLCCAVLCRAVLWASEAGQGRAGVCVWWVERAAEQHTTGPAPAVVCSML